MEAELLRGPYHADVLVVAVGRAYVREKTPRGLEVMVIALKAAFPEFFKGAPAEYAEGGAPLHLNGAFHGPQGFHEYRDVPLLLDARAARYNGKLPGPVPLGLASGVDDRHRGDHRVGFY